MLSFEYFKIRAVADKTAPKLLGGGAMPGKRLALYFDEALDAASRPATSDFVVKVGFSPGIVTGAAVRDNAIVITLLGTIAQNAGVNVTYTVRSNPIKDLAGNAAAGFSTEFIATADTKPTYASALLDGAQVQVTLSGGRLDPASPPSARSVTLRYGLGTGETVPVAYDRRIDVVSISPTYVILDLEHPAFPCDRITASYTKPTSGTKLRSLTGKETDSFLNQSVTNNRSSRCVTRRPVSGNSDPSGRAGA